MLNTLKPFSSTGYDHRERTFTVEAVRALKSRVFVLTDVRPFGDASLASQCDAVLTSLDALTDEDIADSAFYVYFGVDEHSVAPLKRIIKCGGVFIPPLSFDKTRYTRVAASVMQSIDESWSKTGDLFGSYQQHENICQGVDATRAVDGDFLEIGVYSGSSALTAMTHMRNRGIRRKCWLMDTFDGFAYDAASKSSDVIWGGTHLMNREKQLDELRTKASAVQQDYSFIVGDICADPLPPGIQKLALVNVDVDLYEATKCALEKVSPLVQKGGIVVAEDPAGTPGLYGAYVAMTEFLESAEGRKYVKLFMTTQYFLLKIDR